jgi:para-nitrobenzyl esterase
MEPIVTTTSGKVSGVSARDAAVFLGIPYAAAPVGDHRFGPPVPHPSWDGVRAATEYGATALQPHQDFTLIPEPIIGGDDPLNLNVFTPAPGAGSLPVLVWIHGGGFTSGCNASPWYRGLRFARDGVVMVSINYRLGIEGFVLVDDGPPNRGLLDMIAALEWVQQNVAGFGGDPARVTIGGQSAGGMACATLLAIPRARELFRAAILMSGAAPPEACVTLDAAAVTSQRAADHLGVPRLTRAELATLSDARLLEVQAALGGGATGTPDAADLTRVLASGGLTFAPVVDGDLLTTTPLDAARAGAGSDIAVLVGATANEMNMAFEMAGADVDDDAVAAGLGEFGLAPEPARAYRAAHGDESPAGVLGQALTDKLFRVPATRYADARAGTAGPTYAYEFRWPSPEWGGLLGACHCLDIPFAFDNLDAEGVTPVAGAEAPQVLADAVHAAWVGFVTDTDPGWARYDDRRPTMIFDTTSAVVDDPLELERALWEDAD